MVRWLGRSSREPSLIGNVFPRELREEKMEEFINLRQGGMSVIEYSVRFTMLSKYGPYLVSYNIMEKFLYTLFSTTNSLINVFIINGSFRMSGKISNFLATKGETKYKVAPGSSKSYTLIINPCNITVTTSGALCCLPFERRS